MGLPSSRFFFFPATTGFVPVKSLKDLTESAKGVLPRGRCLVTAPGRKPLPDQPMQAGASERRSLSV